MAIAYCAEFVLLLACVAGESPADPGRDLPSGQAPRTQQGQRGRDHGVANVWAVFDKNRNGELSSDEIDSAAAELLKRDHNEDGKLTVDELRPDVTWSGWPPGWMFPAFPVNWNVTNGLDPPISSGFVFILGEYVPPPYIVRETDDRLFINEREVPSGILGTFAPRGWQPPGSRSATLRQFLGNDFVVITLPSQTAVALNPSDASGFALLEFLARDDSSTSAPRDLGPSSVDSEHLRQWLGRFEPPPGLVQRVRSFVSGSRQREQISAELAAAHRWTNRWSYATTVLGMFVVAVAAGHVLSWRRGAESPVRAERSVFVSVALIVLLSSLDLIWTVVAWKTNSMRELNPLGSRLLHDPATLVLFKAAATGGSASLLLTFRRNALAQTASFWMCLVCLLVVCRWLVFKTMFME